MNSRRSNNNLAMTEEAAAQTENLMERGGTIDDVRELLFGQTNRKIESQLQALSEKVDQNHEEMLRLVRNLEVDLAALRNETEDRRLSSIDDIGMAIAQLGASVRTMGAKKKS